MASANRVIVITGATGAGKTTVSQYLTTQYDIPQVITHTTRPPRINEVDGQDYYFETAETFAQKHFIESVTYANYQYGSSYEALDLAFKKSPLVCIVLDTKGAQTYVKQLKKQIVLLYVMVPEPRILANRLIKRGDASEMVKKRLASNEYARDLQLPTPLKDQAQVIVNADWSQTKRRVDAIINELKHS